jgi:dienelactone hydrolase
VNRLVLPVLLVLLAAACGGGAGGRASPVGKELASQFDYDQSAPLGLETQDIVERSGVVLEALTYRTPRGGVLPAFIVRPDDVGPHPAVVLAHGAGQTREDFLSLAATLARRGVTALTFTAAAERSTRADVRSGTESFEVDVQLAIDDVLAIRRAIDLLVAQDYVDGDRVGVLGFSRGGQPAGIAAAVDDRVDAVVLAVTRARPSRTFTLAENRQLYRALDLAEYVGHIAPAAVFVQGGTRDDVIPHGEVRELAHLASEPKRLRWYKAGHLLNAAAFREQVQFLVEELRVE